MISGFYMALILNEKYIGPGSYKTFLQNRFLKIFPTYYACLFLTICISLIFYYLSGNALRLWSYLNYGDHLPLIAKCLLLFSNLAIFGQDLVMFAGVNINSGEFFLTKNFLNSNPPLFYFLLIPQAWSISIELMFYLIAPFIVRRGLLFITFIIGLSLSFKFYILNIVGWNFDPWTYRLFISEISFFLLGALAYHLSQHLLKIANSIQYSKYLIVLCAASFVVFYDNIALSYKYYFICFLFFISIPVAFDLTKKSKIDRYIGELSYPVYLIHYLVSVVTFDILKEHHLLNYRCEIVTVLSILTSILIMHILIKPIEIYRQQRIIKLIKEN